MAKSAASLTGIVALLLVDVAACFLPVPSSASCFNNGPATRICVNNDSPRRTTAAGRASRRRLRPNTRHTHPLEATTMSGGGEGGAKAAGRKTVAIEVSEGVPRGPEGAIKVTYLELNSWMWQVNGLNLLVDPVFGTLDFGVPLLIQARKQVLWDSDRVTKDLAKITDVLVISQGFEDHCHPRTLKALSNLLDPAVRIVAPPSAQGILEENFPASRITYILPGQSTVLSKDGRAVEVRATSGAVLGPPWQQAENGYLVSPAAAAAGGSAPDGGTLYYEPHLMFDPSALSELKADVAIAPVVAQSVGPYPLVCGGEKALQLMSALKASKLVTMANANGDFSGPLGNVVSAGEPLEVFLELAKSENFAVVVPEVGKPVSVWP